MLNVVRVLLQGIREFCVASVFTKIIRGELESYKLYENEQVFALLTRDAIQLGHSVIVPKLEVDKFYDLPNSYYESLFEVARPLAKAIEIATGCLRVGMAFVGLEVPHCHLHLLPLFSAEEIGIAHV